MALASEALGLKSAGLDELLMAVGRGDQSAFERCQTRKRPFRPCAFRDPGRVLVASVKQLNELVLRSDIDVV